jgi:hypothetical protein
VQQPQNLFPRTQGTTAENCGQCKTVPVHPNLTPPYAARSGTSRRWRAGCKLGGLEFAAPPAARRRANSSSQTWLRTPELGRPRIEAAIDVDRQPRQPPRHTRPDFSERLIQPDARLGMAADRRRPLRAPALALPLWPRGVPPPGEGRPVRLPPLLWLRSSLQAPPALGGASQAHRAAQEKAGCVGCIPISAGAATAAASLGR